MTSRRNPQEPDDFESVYRRLNGQIIPAASAAGELGTTHEACGASIWASGL
jgi:hypothetical protein